MVTGFDSFKAAGTIYRINDTEFTKKGYPKRSLLLEIPTAHGDRQKSTVIKFMVLGDETESLDFYKEGEFVEILFRLDGFFWKAPEGDEVHLQSLKIVNMHRRDNPFETKEEVSQDPDDYSPDHLAELTPNVKDYSREKPVADVNNPLPFDPQPDDLPF